MEMESFLRGFVPPDTDTESLEFTLDQGRALQKLSQAQLPEQSLWTVKMVQAAVRGDAAEVDIKLGRNKIEVKFASTHLPSAKEIYQLVRSGQLTNDPFLLHLTTGIRTSFAGEGVSFLIQTVGPQGKNVVAFSDGSSVHFTDELVTKARSTLTFVIRRPYRMLGFRKSLHRPVSQLVKGTAAEHLDLITRCWACPIPLKIDGRLVDTRYDSPLMFRGNVSRIVENHRRRNPGVMPVCFYLRYYPSELGKPSLKTDQLEQGQRGEITLDSGQKVLYKKPVFVDGRFLEWAYDGERAKRVLISPIGAGRKPHIFFVHDGALVQKAPIKLIPDTKLLGITVDNTRAGGDMVIEAVDFEDLDLSQFKVRNVEQRRAALLNWMMKQSIECSDVLVANLKHYYPVSASEEKAKVGAALVGAGALAAGIGFGGLGLGVYSAYQGMFVGGSLFFRSQFLSLLRKAYLKTRDKLLAMDVTTIEQPPIE
jgi:hypothetical protein